MYQIIVISSSKFGPAETCPTFYMYTSLSSRQIRCTFSKNTISECRTDQPLFYFSALQATPLNYSYLATLNCRLRGIKGTREVAGNSNPTSIRTHKDTELISVGTKYHFIFSVNSSCFIDNQYLILLSLLSISNYFDNYPSKVTMNVYDTTMRNNLATSVLVLVEGVEHFRLTPKIAIVLKELLVDGKIVTNTQRTYAISAGDLESSMLRFLTVDKVLIED